MPSSHAQPATAAPEPLPGYHSILLAVDSSDHANRASTEAVSLAGRFHARLTAAHVYAAKLHDLRFRQMEGGLPEQFREEQELERQRDVHDDLITRGLSIITDSYLDQVERAAAAAGVGLTRRSLEGKNYRQLAGEANSGDYDLLVLGALGLGAIGPSRIGTVCRRVARRSSIDTLVIKQPQRSLDDGPIVVAVDGSEKAYGGLLTALALARQWHSEIKVISAFDPYYHYVAFNRIAGVLSDEAGKVFKFKEQEQLHEEIIDSGLAKIYQGHLAVAQSIASDYGVEIETVLLDGKPHDVINRYLGEVDPALLILGTTGIHADTGLDIGGNSELLLEDAGCNLLLSQRRHQPRLDRLASVTTSWSNEAEQRMQRVPSFVRPMAKMAILRYAQEHGHTVITEKIVDEATAQLMPNHAEQAMSEIVDAHDRGELQRKPDNSPQPLRWSEAATRLLLTIDDLSLRGNLSMRAEKRARSAGAGCIEAEHIEPFLDQPPTEKAPLHWQAAALARLMRVPEGFMRDSSKQRIEEYAQSNSTQQITLEVAEAGLAEARGAMASAMQGQTGSHDGRPADQQPSAGDAVDSSQWTTEAEQMLQSVPAGFCRDMTRKAAETIAAQNGLQQIDPLFVAQVMETFKAGAAANNDEQMPWQPSARQRIARAPDSVRGMLIKEIEAWSGRNGLQQVSDAAVDAVKQQWAERGVFHLGPDDPRNS